MVFDLVKNKKNIIAFLLSLIIALILWSLAKTNEVVEVERNLALQIKTSKDLIVKTLRQIQSR